MARFRVQMPTQKFFRGWIFVGLLGVVITAIVFVTRGGVQTVEAGLNDPGGCRIVVTGTDVNVRSQPSITAPVVGNLHQGDLRPATRTVRNGFRALTSDQWVSDGYVSPVPGATCS